MRAIIGLLSIVNRARALVLRRRIERDLDEELAFHLEAKVRDQVASGVPEGEARLSARRAFGNVTLVAEDGRAAWRFAWLDSVFQDLRYGARALCRTPLFTVAAVLTLALGIGANTAIFTLIDRVLLRPMSFQDPDRLVSVGARPSMGMIQSDGPPDRDTDFFSVPMFGDLQRLTDVFSGLAAAGSFPVTAYLGDGSSEAGRGLERVTALLASGNLFQVLGTPVPLGRALTPEDDVAGAGRAVVVLGHGLWTRKFGRDPSVVGRTIRANGTSYTVVGVAGAQLRGLALGIDADLWIPIAMQPALMREASLVADRNSMWLRLIGRLESGVTAGQARARVNDLYRQLVAAEAGTDLTPATKAAIARLSIELVPFARGFSGLRERWGRPLLVLMAVVGFVLLIACANVGNLLLARASSRRRELSLRLALGAGRGRLARQLLTESLMLSMLGGAAGLLVAQWTIRFLLGILSTRGAAAIDAGVDGRVLLFTAAVTGLAALLFGLVPAVRAARTGIGVALRNSSSRIGGDRGGWRLRRALVVLQVAASLSLLVGAGLLLRSLGNLLGQDAGFRAGSVVVAEIDPQGGGIDGTLLPSLHRTLLDRIGALPGVSSASLSLYGLLSGSQRNQEASVDGRGARPGEDTRVQELFVTPRYFETIGASLASGRGFDERDREGAAPVAVVSESFARHFFGSEPSAGRRFGFDGPSSSRQIEIVGTVRDIKTAGMKQQAPRLVYRPAAQVPGHLNSIEVRTTGAPAQIASELRRVIAEVAPALPVLDVSTLSAQVDRSLREDRMLGQLTGLFGLLALALACIGLHGVLAYGVAQRTGEIGIRLALGASRGQVSRMVLRQALSWIGAGTVLGLAVTMALGRLIAGLLFGVDPFDPVTMIVAAATLAVVALAASYWPARRAARLDPLVALRCE